MRVSYKKLWKLLIDKDMKKKDLIEAAGISKFTLSKLNGGKSVTTDTLVKICAALHTYAYEKYFVCSDDEIATIRAFVKEKCLANGNVLMDEIPLDNIVVVNYELSTSAIYDFLYNRLRDMVDRKANMLSFYGESDDLEKQIANYCKGRRNCTLDDVCQIMNALYL